MVRDDNIHALRGKPSEFGGLPRSAIDQDHDLGPGLHKRFKDWTLQTASLQRTSPMDLCPQSPKRPRQDCKAGKSVDVSVGVNGDRLFAPDSLAEPLDRFGHVRHVKGRKMERRLQELVDRRRRAETATAKDLQEGGMQRTHFFEGSSGFSVRARGRMKRKSAPLPASDSTQTFPR